MTDTRQRAIFVVQDLSLSVVLLHTLNILAYEGLCLGEWFPTFWGKTSLEDVRNQYPDSTVSQSIFIFRNNSPFVLDGWHVAKWLTPYFYMILMTIVWQDMYFYAFCYRLYDRLTATILTSCHSTAHNRASFTLQLLQSWGRMVV